jgi:acyl-CoA thioester hydrolase
MKHESDLVHGRELVARFSWPVRVYYEDTDSGGVVYYANYLKFLERARTEWLRAAGFEQTALAHDHHVIFVVRSVAIEYVKSARFNDLLEVTVDLREVGRSQVVVAQTVTRQGKGTDLLVQAEVKLVCVNDQTFKPARIPEVIQQCMGK